MILMMDKFISLYMVSCYVEESRQILIHFLC
jgi:hypothetical protein